MEILGEYLLFLAKTATVVVAVLAALSAGRQLRGGGEGALLVRNLNDHYQRMGRIIKAATSGKPAFKLALWRRAAKSEEQKPRRRVFVLNFAGDLRASAVAALREEITGILSDRREGDEVVLRLESLGGIVASYGLAASQLVRLKEQGIPITVCVDRMAASGGYMMACVADRLLAAPFAVVGSIGVVAQLPNFHRLLKRHDVDLEQFHAGEYKRTVTLFGENTEEDRAKLREQVEEAYRLFKEFVALYRPQLDLERVATGEYWYGTRAVELGLVDGLRTSDDYLLEASREAGLYEVRYLGKKPRAWWLRQLGR